MQVSSLSLVFHIEQFYPARGHAITAARVLGVELAQHTDHIVDDLVLVITLESERSGFALLVVVASGIV